MTQPYGHPDWQTPQPNVNTPLIVSNYNGNGNFIFPAVSFVGYTQLFIVWQPATNQQLIISWRDPQGNAVSNLFFKRIVVRANKIAIVNVPVMLGNAVVQAFDLANGAMSGSLTLLGGNGSDSHDALIGVTEIFMINNLLLAPSGDQLTDATYVVEGKATFVLHADQAGALANLWAYNDLGVRELVVVNRIVTPNIDVVTPVHIPARNLAVELFNSSTTSATFYCSLIAGG